MPRSSRSRPPQRKQPRVPRIVREARRIVPGIAASLTPTVQLTPEVLALVRDAVRTERGARRTARAERRARQRVRDTAPRGQGMSLDSAGGRTATSAQASPRTDVSEAAVEATPSVMQPDYAETTTYFEGKDEITRTCFRQACLTIVSNPTDSGMFLDGTSSKRDGWSMNVSVDTISGLLNGIGLNKSFSRLRELKLIITSRANLTTNGFYAIGFSPDGAATTVGGVPTTYGKVAQYDVAAIVGACRNMVLECTPVLSGQWKACELDIDSEADARLTTDGVIVIANEKPMNGNADMQYAVLSLEGVYEFKGRVPTQGFAVNLPDDPRFVNEWSDHLRRAPFEMRARMLRANRGAKWLFNNEAEYIRARRTAPRPSGPWLRRVADLPPDPPLNVNVTGGNVVVAGEVKVDTSAPLNVNVASTDGPLEVFSTEDDPVVVEQAHEIGVYVNGPDPLPVENIVPRGGAAAAAAAALRARPPPPKR